MGKSTPNRCAGGSAANTIVGIAEFGGKTAYCGKVANDEAGSFFLEDMRQLGVTIDVPPTHEGTSGTCAVLITPDAQRTMLTNLGVSAILCENDAFPAGDVKNKASWGSGDVENKASLLELLQAINQAGGEGLMLRKRSGIYQAGRSANVIKMKDI